MWLVRKVGLVREGVASEEGGGLCGMVWLVRKVGLVRDSCG